MPSSNLGENEEFHRELLRTSKDLFMVYNPTDRDFVVEVSGTQGFNVVIPNKNKNMGFGNGKREVERWVMELYRKHMVVQLINQLGDEKGKAELAELAKSNIRFKDKYEENTAVWNNQKIVPRTDNPELVEQFSEMVVLGLTKEFDSEVAEQDMTEYQNKLDPIDKKIERITNRKYVPDAEDEANIPTIYQEPETDTILPATEELKVDKKKLEKELTVEPS